ncbi:flagellar hook-basal body complex protein FliE [Pseudogemmobacter faecipullorum]|uniref:Flagellar hook-basal body complex protein FliE n=1 Tax=Pseudogemmobacter faecipullorum TaxID=2755041 RepID=A0ABS8CJN0_9RHOB|nr:flagellar hook-basal body complex protein FliE [Pseudogemmobacter faecipullorum]MCB5409574.1 flagellar hook-basal body complex protein FliE [Pseudogemmobacter faecipullorum]
MDAISSFAAQGYARARTAAASGPAAPEGIAAMAGSFTAALSAHEQTARAAMAGGADPHSLVAALSSSQLAVETVASLRDRVVEAYQEILRMPV